MKPFAIGAARLAALGFTVSGCIPQPWLASAGPRGYRRNQSKYQFATDRWGDLLIVMEGQPKEIWSLLPYGESEHPASPHYNDLARLHSQRLAKRFWFTPEEIVAHTESVRGDRNRIHVMLRVTSPKD